MVEANIVRDFTIGNTRIKIADDCCRTAGEAKQILKDISVQVQRQLIAAASIKHYGQEENANSAANGG